VLITAHVNRLRLASYRPSSIRARETCLRSFERTLADHRSTLTTAGRLEVEAFLGRDLKPESRRAYRGHLRGFYAWALEEGYVHSDPTDKLPTIRVPQAVPRPIRDDDLRKAVALAHPRMRAWLLLMALAGLRCIEVANLRPEDVSATDTGALLFLREVKGGGTATVPAHEAVLAALVQLPSRDGLWWDCSPRHVSTSVSAYLRSVEVDATAHRLRHWAGTNWYRASEHDLLATAQLLRHKSVKSSQVYAQLDPTRPAAVVGLVRLPTHLHAV
jgi:integrase